MDFGSILATMETEFRNGVRSIPVKVTVLNGWIVRPPVIQHRERNLTKY